MTTKTKLHMKRLLAVCLTCAAVGGSMLPEGVEAAADAGTSASAVSAAKLANIRVALFIDAGKYKATTDRVTLSSAGSLTVGLRKADSVYPWFNVAANTSIHIALDDYKVLLLETTDLAGANTAANKLSALGYDSFMLPEEKNGQKLYRVYACGFAAKAEADQAANAMKLNTSISTLTKGFAAAVTGPLRLSAGVYETEADANKQLALLRGKGFNAAIAVTDRPSGKPAFAVWVGEAADPAQLSRMQLDIATALPGLAPQPVAAETAYALKRGGSDGSSPYYFINPQTTKLWTAPAAGTPAGIKVEERYGRLYRGGVEVSGYRSQLAVINELPFEEYLYSVVSSELGDGWPSEVLKAQAVAARTYALVQGLKYGIAHVSDTTYDQAYKGLSREAATAVAAVQATAGEVLMNQDGLITPFYHSNAGNMTANAEEVWGRPIEYLKSVPSPDDVAQKGKMTWYRVVMSDGRLGYIRSDLAKSSGRQTRAGLPILQVTEDGVNVRGAPYVDNDGNPSISKLNSGDLVVQVEESPESTSYQWMRGPYDAAGLLNTINDALSQPISQGVLTTLAVSKRSTPSGRVTEMKANGKIIPVSAPDSYRTVMGGLPSTRFDVEQTANVSVLGAGGATRNIAGGEALVAAGASASQAAPLSGNEYALLGSGGDVRIATQEPQFRFIGLGYGHGLGMSQWGARGLAELGYDYKGILKYYYEGTTLAKG